MSENEELENVAESTPESVNVVEETPTETPVAAEAVSTPTTEAIA